MRVKICGLTNPDDAHAAIDAGANALGFNLWPGSKRHIVLEECADWIAALPPFVSRVAVLVNAPLEEAQRVAMHPAIDVVQFHGDESADYLNAFARLGRPFIVARRIADRSHFAQAAALPTRHVLIDAAVSGAYGGTGQTLDFTLAADFVASMSSCHVILAGGLTPANVGEAVVKVRPYAVDVASGVESEPRRKDAAKLRAFVAAVRAADARIRGN